MTDECCIGSNHLAASPLAFRIWPIQDSAKDVFPEHALGLAPNPNPDDHPARPPVNPLQQQGLRSDRRPIVGLAVSGGGARSHTLFCGYMRALHELKLADKIDYLSSVSGGSWAASIYTFAREDSFTDEVLLGTSVRPEQCTLEFLQQTSPGAIAEAITSFHGFLYAAKEAAAGVPIDKLWQVTVGKELLGRFGLHQKIMAANEDHIKRIIEFNEQQKLTKSLVLRDRNKFVCPRRNRPFLILNATLMGPKGYSSGWGTSIQFTPLYSGVPFYRDMKQMGYVAVSFSGCLELLLYKTILGMPFPTDRLNEEFVHDEKLNGDIANLKLTIGGGVVDSFAFGTRLLVDPNDYYAHDQSANKHKRHHLLNQLDNSHPDGKVQIVKGVMQGELFTLEDAVGASSAAFVAGWKNHAIAYSLQPKDYYFPILSKQLPQFSEYQEPRELVFGDGGNYDNTGLMSLLQRGLRKCICFINSKKPLDIKFEKDVFIESLASHKKRNRRSSRRMSRRMSKNARMYEHLFIHEIKVETAEDVESDTGEDDPGTKKHLKKKTIREYQCCTEELLSLFGVVSRSVMTLEFNYKDNQVFETGMLNDVMFGMIESLRNGKGAVTRKVMKLLPNKSWNILGGYDVDVIFIYNEHCTEFEHLLPEETKKEISLGHSKRVKELNDRQRARARKGLKRFPLYNTTFQGRTTFSLKNDEVTLLAAHAEFLIKQHADMFLDFFDH